MEKDYFIFNKNKYYTGTIIEIQNDKKEFFSFNKTLKFSRYDNYCNAYCFTSLHDIWTEYKIQAENIELYINKILVEVKKDEDNCNKTNPQYIDGIIVAWSWYVILMFFSLCLSGVSTKILALIGTTVVFFNWRNKKINGG